jgi:hypothetical protein
MGLAPISCMIRRNSSIEAGKRAEVKHGSQSGCWYNPIDSSAP